MNLEYPFPPPYVRGIDDNPSVEPAGSQQGGVKYVGSVGSRDQDNSLIGVKAIHLHQELVQGLLPFVMTSSQTGSSMPAHGIYLVDKDYAGGVFLPLFEEVAHSGSSYPDEHLHKVGTAYGEKGDISFPGNCSG